MIIKSEKVYVVHFGIAQLFPMHIIDFCCNVVQLVGLASTPLIPKPPALSAFLTALLEVQKEKGLLLEQQNIALLSGNLS